MKKPTLNLLSSRKLRDKKIDLMEPSGLSCDPKTGHLWTVSDSGARLFELDWDGVPINHVTLEAGRRDYEGVTCLPGNRAALAGEEGSEILIVDRASGATLQRKHLSEIAGSDALPVHLVKGDVRNNGLEGLSYDPERDRFMALVERNPRLLIEISGDLSTILTIRPFDPDEGEGNDISGLTHDLHRDLFWIVSDTGCRVILYDARSGNRKSARLTRKGKKVEKAEGVALSPDGRRLYVVTDAGKKSRFLAYEIRRPKPAKA